MLCAVLRREEELTAAPARRCADLLLVPVVRIRATAVATGGQQVVALSGEAELVGVWLARAGGTSSWLPCREAPEGASSWVAWLAERPALLHDVAARLRDAGPA